MTVGVLLGESKTAKEKKKWGIHEGEQLACELKKPLGLTRRLLLHSRLTRQQTVTSARVKCGPSTQP